MFYALFLFDAPDYLVRPNVLVRVFRRFVESPPDFAADLKRQPDQLRGVDHKELL